MEKKVLTKSFRKFGCKFVVLKNRHGEKQTFQKKVRNLMWHCGPVERQYSAASVTKRNMKEAARSSAYGP
jgi:hypothetical protein